MLGVVIYPQPESVIVRLSTCPSVTLAWITACVTGGGADIVIVGAIS